MLSDHLGLRPVRISFLISVGGTMTALMYHRIIPGSWLHPPVKNLSPLLASLQSSVPLKTKRHFWIASLIQPYSYTTPFRSPPPFWGGGTSLLEFEVLCNSISTKTRKDEVLVNINTKEHFLNETRRLTFVWGIVIFHAKHFAGIQLYWQFH